MSHVRPHRKLVKHYHEPGDFHELTFSCYHRMPLLTNDDWKRRLSPKIDQACRVESFDLVAFVYMPEHIHLLVYPRVPEPNIGRFLARIKHSFSTEIKKVLVDNASPLLNRLTVRERPGKYSFRFWEEGPGYDRNISSSRALLASIDYIHNNPIKRGLCRRAIDWTWSSARYHILEPPRQQFPELPYIHGLPPGAFDDTVGR